MKTRRIAIAGAAFVVALGLAGGLGWRGHRSAHAARSSRAADVTITRAPAGRAIRDLVAKGSKTCALYTDGHAVCWTQSTYSTSVEERREPARVPGLTGAVALAVGDRHGCALDAEGHVSCWGYCDLVCQNGGGPLLLRTATRIESVPRLRAIATEDFGETTCGVGVDDEELHCWYGTSPSRNWFGDPVPPHIEYAEKQPHGEGRWAAHAHTGAVQLVAGASGSHCARFAGGRARCWSEGLTDGNSKPFASLDAPTAPVRAMSGSYYETCFVLDSGEVECRSTDGVLRPHLGKRMVAAAATSSSLCAIGADGALSCRHFRWNDARSGAPDNDASRHPKIATFEDEARDAGGPVRAIVAGASHFCALRDDDAVLCWYESGHGGPERVALENAIEPRGARGRPGMTAPRVPSGDAAAPPTL